MATITTWLTEVQHIMAYAVSYGHKHSLKTTFAREVVSSADTETLTLRWNNDISCTKKRHVITYGKV